MTSVWETLSHIDVNQHTEKKGNLTYLSWAWAWGKVKETYPQATYEKRIWSTELPYTQDDQGFAYVQVSVEIEEQSLSEVMPVLQRCLAKCCAMHGLGHYIYAGEDLPPDEDGLPQKQPVPQEEAPPPFVPDTNSVSIIETTKTDEEMRALEKDAYEVFIIPSQIARATSEQDLDAWHTKNKQKLNDIKQNFPKDYLIIKNQFEARWKSLGVQ